MISKILIISLVACIANAVSTTGSLHKKSEESAHKEGCYIKEINDVVPFGTRVNPIGYCYTLHCQSTSEPGGFMLSALGCGSVASLDENCHLTETDLTKPYPECCPYFVCD